MKARHAVLTLLLLSLFGLGSVKAQFAYTVSWDTGQVPMPRIQTFNDTVRYTLTITNNTLTPFADTLQFMLRTQVGGPFMIADLGGQFIPALGSQTFSFLDSTSALRYGGGINVVVVWPTVPSGDMVTDSLIDTLRINTVAVDPPMTIGALEVYPNPAHSQLHLRLKDLNLIVAYTELYDITGRVIYRAQGLPSTIPLDDVPPAIYFVRVRAGDGRSTSFKFIKD